MEADRDYSIQDDKGVKQVLVRSRLGGYLLNVYGNSLEDEGSKRFFESASHMIQNKDGSVVVVASDKRVVAIDLKNDKKLYDGDFTFIYYISLSPAENFIQIFDKYEINMGRTTLLTFPQFYKVNEFPEGASSNFVDKEGYPLIKFTSDDKLYFRFDKKAIELYDSTHKRSGVIELGQIKLFTVSKIATEKDYLLVVFFLDNKTKHGKILMYTHESLIYSCYIKNIEKAEEIKVKWSPVCHDFLVELQTFVDPTGKSYYGEYGLYFFNSKDKKMNQVKTYEGPLHDFNWDPTGEKFAVISGFMPAGAVLFNNKNEPVYEFGKMHKNTAAWNPQGRFLCLAGFGNLNGYMEIWDIPLTKKIGYCKSSSASMCTWAPDGRKVNSAL